MFSRCQPHLSLETPPCSSKRRRAGALQIEPLEFTPLCCILVRIALERYGLLEHLAPRESHRTLADASW